MKRTHERELLLESQRVHTIVKTLIRLTLLTPIASLFKLLLLFIVKTVSSI